MNFENPLFVFSSATVESVAEFLTNKGDKKTEFDAVFCDIGPAPFTGLRVGMAFALAFSKAKNLPLFGFSAMEAAAEFANKSSAFSKFRKNQMIKFENGEFEIVRVDEEKAEEIKNLQIPQNNQDFERHIVKNAAKFVRDFRPIYIQEPDAIANIPKPFFQVGSDENRSPSAETLVQSVTLENLPAFANEFAKKLENADTIYLSGDLGSGKTTFTAAVLKALGVKEDVVSPSFTVAKEHASNLFEKIVHIDAYRHLENEKENAETIVRASSIFSDNANLTFIEWGETFSLKPDEKGFFVKISSPETQSSSENERVFEIQQFGKRKGIGKLEEQLKLFAEVEQLFPVAERNSEQFFKSVLTSSSYKVFTNDFGIAIILLPKFSDEPVHILSFGILKQFQRKGYGKKLLNEIVEFLKTEKYEKIFLDVSESNFSAINLYLQAGFVEIDRTKKFYGDGSTAIQMTLDLQNQAEVIAENFETQSGGSKKLFLGIESSCDETGIAICSEDELIAEVLASSMDEHVKFGGVIPEIASRAHLESFESLFAALIDRTKDKIPNFKIEDIFAIGVTAAPGLVGCLAVGTAFAKGLALALQKPFFAVNHVVAHLFASGIEEKLPEKFIGLVVSGGHSSIVKVDGMQIVELGKTIDDAAGEVFDKVGRMLNLNYPAGKEIDDLAKNGNHEKFDFPLPLVGAKFEKNHKFDFSFSGLKTAAKRKLEATDFSKMSEQEIRTFRNDFCASFAHAVAKVIALKTIRAADENGVKTIVLGGGFSANSQLRELMQKECLKNGIELIVPKLKFCTDNGSMVANLTRILEQNNSSPSSLSTSVHSTLPLEKVQI